MLNALVNALQNVPGQPSPRNLLKLAGNISTFSGQDGVRPETYLDSFNLSADLANLTSAKKLQIIGSKLTDYAATWYRNLRNSAQMETLRAAADPFAAFSAVFNAQFTVGDVDTAARQQIRNLVWTGTVEGLATDIMRISANTAINDGEQCDRFMELLPPAVGNYVRLQRSALARHLFSDAIQFAKAYVETIQHEKPTPVSEYHHLDRYDHRSSSPERYYRGQRYESKSTDGGPN